MQTVKAIFMDEKDNVATLTAQAKKGDTVSACIGEQMVTQLVVEEIPYGHKIALQRIAVAENVIKYGNIIGRAVSDIPAGTHVHVHNIESISLVCR